MLTRYSSYGGLGSGAIGRAGGTAAMPRAVHCLLMMLPLLLALPAAAQPGGAPPSQCPDNMDVYADTAEVITCHCPAMLMSQGAVWGTDIYTADSATCRAAQHAGVLNRQ